MKNQLIQCLLLAIVLCSACGGENPEQTDTVIRQSTETPTDQGNEPGSSLDDWTYQSIALLQAESNTALSSIDFGDINNDGLIDLINGNLLYKAVQDDPMNWEVAAYGSEFQGIAIMYLGEERGTGIVGLRGTKLVELLPNLDNPETMDAKVVADIPASRRNKIRQCKKAQLIPGGAQELLITGREGIYMVEADDMDEWSVSLIAPDANSSRFDLGDIDRDQDLDIVAAIDDGGGTKVVWFENPGDGSEYWNSHELTAVGGTVTQIGLAKLDSDDRIDLILNSGGTEEGQNITSYMQADTGWVKQAELLNGMDILFEIDDIDGNGTMDVTTMHTSRDGSKFCIWPNDADGKFSQVEVAALEGSPIVFRQVDIDGDGDLDVVYLVGDNEAELAVYINGAIGKEK